MNRIKQEVAVMLSKKTHQLIFLPVGVFPNTTAAGRIIKITIERCEWLEKQSIDEVVSDQEQILRKRWLKFLGEPVKLASI